jgi:glucose dehydrogenase
VFGGGYLYIVATSGQVFALDLDKQQIVWQNNPLNTKEQEGK